MQMVLIDMDMPKSCDFCDLVRTQDNLSTEDRRFMVCEFTGEYVDDCIASRHTNCPIVAEIPYTTSWLQRLVRPKTEVENFANRD